MKKSMFISLVFIISVVLTACGNAEDKTQGKWSYDEDGEKVFLKIEDRNAEVSYMGLIMEGKLENVEKNQFSLKLEDDSKVKFKLDGNKLKDEDGNTWKKKE